MVKNSCTLRKEKTQISFIPNDRGAGEEACGERG